MSDPSGFLRPSPKILKIVGTSRNDLNGCVCLPISFSNERYLVNIATLASPSTTTTGSSNTLSLKPSNLTEGNMVDKMKYKTFETRAQVQQILNDPNVRREMSRIYQNFQSKLPPFIKKPEYVLYGLLALLLVSIRFLGISKTILLLSVAILTLMVSAPDLFGGFIPGTAGSNNNNSTVNRSGKEIILIAAKNFPSRFRAILVQSTGFNQITDKMALGIYLMVIFFSFRLIMAPSPAIATATASRMTSTTSGTQNQEILNEYYRLGFEDGKAGHSFGKSLPALEDEPILSSSSSQDINWDNVPPLPPSSRMGSIANKFSFYTAMAMMNIIRTLKSLGTNPAHGGFDVQLMLANLKMMQPMQMGFLGLSVYRVLSVFLF